MPAQPQPLIKNLALIGDQKSCAFIDQSGTVAWYCLWRFDQPSLFSLLVDENGGFWSIEAEGKTFNQRRYTDDSAVLVSEFAVAEGSFTVTDFMPMDGPFCGLCRLLSPAPAAVTVRLFPTPDYNRRRASLQRGDDFTVLEDGFEFFVKGSHPLTIRDQTIEMLLPPGESGWCVLAEEKKALRNLTASALQMALHATQAQWTNIMQNLAYNGPYKAQMLQSYKALQLMRHRHSGGILAAGTTSLPEKIGAGRNYDYRYVWLRDTAMNISALLRAGSKGNEAQQFLDFLYTGRHTNKKNLFVPFYDLDMKTAPFESLLPGTGYRRSTPLRMGNNATDQLQLDAQGNILLAAKEIYNRIKARPHWKTIVKTAEFIVRHWMEEDHGIWEEHLKRHFTSSKVIITKSLEYIARHSKDEKQKKRWLQTAQKIRQFIATNCMTNDGAYAVYAGSQAVDVTAALFAVWEFDKPDSAAMQQSIYRIEKDLKEGELYHRYLINSNGQQEGVFLAGCLWMAQHYVMLNNLPKAKSIVDAVLQFSTDLGFLPEEGDIKTGEALGNLPQTFVHASLMGVIVDYKDALEKGQQ